MFHPRKYWKKLGPGIITGAADDDPSGVVTYAQTGARFGYGFLWLALFTTPLMIAAQEMSARLGLVTHRGLTALVRQHVSAKIAVGLAVLVFLTNTLNLGADVGAMSEVLKLLAPVPTSFAIIGFAAVILALEIWLSYKRYANILKWLSLALLAYVAAAFSVHQDWGAILHHTLVPIWLGGRSSLTLIVGVLGTTISPYLFIWQASEEVEEEPAKTATPTAMGARLQRMRKDTYTGMIYSNIMMFFIILTTAATLHQAGLVNIGTARQAAEALRPVAGHFTFWLFALGIIGIGLQSIPVLAGSAAYAVSEVFGWREGLAKKLRQARGFYLAIAVSMIIGIISNFLGWSPVKFLIATAVLNGLLAPVLLFFIIRLADDARVVGDHLSTRSIRWWGWFCFSAMTLAGLILIRQWIWP
ncbi:MAG: divalent metal cation transporter [Candidatus Kerfeldbacteria bacterium]|nr:divalent metal cation transporter [Candidatus Kerfeldbacteria bacterium]